MRFIRFPVMITIMTPSIKIRWHKDQSLLPRVIGNNYETRHKSCCSQKGVMFDTFCILTETLRIRRARNFDTQTKTSEKITFLSSDCGVLKIVVCIRPLVDVGGRGSFSSLRLLGPRPNETRVRTAVVIGIEKKPS